MQGPTPHVPAFGLLAVSTTLAYATFHAAVPLLPLLLPPASSATAAAVALAAFSLPSLPLYPVVSSAHLAPSLPLILSSGALLQAVGSLLLAATRLLPLAAAEGVAITAARPHRLSALPITACALVTGSLFVAGVGAALSQFGLVRLVSDRMLFLSASRRRQLVGVHLAVLEACIATGTAVAPVSFAAIGTARGNVFLPFLFAGTVQLILAFYITFGTPLNDLAKEGRWNDELAGLTSEPRASMGAYGSCAERPGAMTKSEHSHGEVARTTDAAELEEYDPGVLYALRHPWVWMVLFTMMISAASVSFVRPVLTPRVTDDLGGSRMFGASLFSLAALVGVVSESLATAVLSPRVGIRSTVVLGLLICLAGFRLLARKAWIAAAVVLLIAGSSSSLVMTLTDLSQTTQVNVVGVSNSLNLLAAVTFSVGEIGGTLAAGVLYDARGSFEETVVVWSHFLAVACVIVVTPYLIGILLQCLNPWVHILSFSESTRDNTVRNSPSLLGAEP